MATAQINVRIDADLKQAGDRTLAAIGYTPTRAIRALWTFAAQSAVNMHAIRDLFSQLEQEQKSAAQDSMADDRIKRVAEGPLIIEEALRDMGVKDYTPTGFCDKEALEDALGQKYGIGALQQ